MVVEAQSFLLAATYHKQSRHLVFSEEILYQFGINRSHEWVTILMGLDVEGGYEVAKDCLATDFILWVARLILSVQHHQQPFSRHFQLYEVVY